MVHMIQVDAAIRMLNAAGYDASRSTAGGVLAVAKDGKEVAATLISDDDTVARHALKHLIGP